MNEVKETIIGAQERLDMLNNVILREVKGKGRTSGRISLPKRYIDKKVRVEINGIIIVSKVSGKGRTSGSVSIPKKYIGKTVHIRIL